MVSKWTGIPITAVKEEESQKLLRMEEELHKRIVSQESAISALSRAIRRTRAGLKNPNRPVGSFLFLGPTGVGKTEVARSLAAFLFGSERALVRFDMSEYMEKHSVSKLIGSPPGYVGHEEGGQLTERVKRNPYSVVLLDEIEKAHPDVFNVLLQVFEDGHLTDGLGNTIDFKNAILIMTSNIGARFIEKKGRMGFQSNEPRDTEKSITEMVMGEVKKTFNPEFINRIDEIIVFDALTDADLVRITRLLVEQMNQNLKEKAITITITDEAVEWLLKRTLSDRSYGARPLRRAIQRHVEDALSEAFIRGQVRPGRPIEIAVDDGRRAAIPAGRTGGSALGMRRISSRRVGAFVGGGPHRRCSRRIRCGRKRPARGGGAGGGAGGDPEQPVPAAGDPAFLHLDEGGGSFRRAAVEGRLSSAVGHGFSGRPDPGRAGCARGARWCSSGWWSASGSRSSTTGGARP